MAYLRFELLLSPVLKLAWSGDVLVTLSGSHVVIRESAARYRNLDQQVILAFFGAMKRGNSRYCQVSKIAARRVRKKNRLRSHASKEQQDVVAIKTHQADEKVTR